MLWKSQMTKYVVCIDTLWYQIKAQYFDMFKA